MPISTISESVPPKTVNMNLEAFEEGLKRAADLQRPASSTEP